MIAIAGQLRQCVRSSDTVARLGGDEFIIFLDELTEEQEAIEVANRAIEELKTPFFIEGREVLTTASIGIAFNTNGDETASDILRNADLAMYGAKERGKSCHALFNPILYDRSQRRLALETDLRLALERHEFLVYYQPIVSLKTLTINSFEALIRWQHPQNGLLYHQDFLPVAEETGSIIAIGQWVLYESCRQMSLWRHRYPQTANLKISINITAKQLQSPHIAEQIEAILQQTGLPATNLKLEITESVLLESTESTINLLLRLKERGIGVSIDDFGTGHSFLSYLHRLPIDTLKIDRSFVARMGDNQRIIESIVTLAHHLEIEVVAEGIETKEHLVRLQELACEYGQGDLLAKPLVGQAAEQLFGQPTLSFPQASLHTTFKSYWD